MRKWQDMWLLSWWKVTGVEEEGPPPGINPEEGKADKSKYPFWLCELSLV